MRKRIINSFLLGFLFIALSTVVSAQYDIATDDGTTIDLCFGTFTDSNNGDSGAYDNNENYSITFCVDVGNQVTIDFTSWNVENNGSCAYDEMIIYDGTSTGSPVIGSYCNSSPGTITATGTCIHIVFTSDGSVTESGWDANVYSSTYGNYRDEFASANYNNSNGNINWTSDNWTEMDDDGITNTGDVYISGGTLQLNNSIGFNSGATPSVERSVNLTNATSAIVTFDYSETANFEGSDQFQFAVFDGTVWNVLLEVDDDFGSQNASIDITAYANANTKVRFEITSFFGASDEVLFVDNFNIAYCRSLGEDVVDFYLEAECTEISSSWFSAADLTASNNFYVEGKVGLNSTSSPPLGIEDRLRYTFTADSTTNYKIFGRIIAPDGSSNSFWVRVNEGTWYLWNGFPVSATWSWNRIWDSDNGNTPIDFPLIDGINTLDIAYREDGTQLDKLFITIDGVAPSDVGEDAINCQALFGLDTDGDGIVDETDIDDDNDGIPDDIESPATISFSSNKTLLVGSSISDLQVNDVVVYGNAVRDCDDIFYDITIKVNTISPGVLVEASNQGMEIDNASAADDDHFTFTLTVVESGSATVANPSGTIATIDDFLFTPRDIDSNDGVDHTEVLGVSNSTPPDNVTFNSTTFLEAGGFINGSGPGTGYTYYRMTALSGTNNWTSNGNDGPGTALEYAVFMFYSSFSTIDIAYGRTGTASATSQGRRLTSLFASKECDRDMDGVPNRIDLDLDNDGIFDLYEAGHALQDTNNDGRIDGAENTSGTNGLTDALETIAGSGVVNYTYSNSDADGIQDFFDRDSDDDACFDTIEGDNPDPDNDGTAGSGTATSDASGLVVSIVYSKPPTNIWQDASSGCLEICDNGIDDDDDGDIDGLDTDCANYFLEAECGFPGDNWNRGMDVDASNDDYLTIGPGLESLASAPMANSDLVKFTVSITAAGLYRILARVYSVSGADDSFWFRVDEGTWYKWNDWNTASTWQWRTFSNNDDGNTDVKFNLSVGIHTIDIAYRENGARIDKLHLTINGTTPADEGETAINCGRTFTPNLFLPYKLLNK